VTLIGALIAHKGHKLKSSTSYEIPQGKVYGAPHVIVRCGTCQLNIWDEALEVLRPDAKSYHIEDNVTGARMSKNFPALKTAENVCGSLNGLNSGGRFGVYDEKGERA
jgi:hypothetical protein